MIIPVLSLASLACPLVAALQVAVLQVAVLLHLNALEKKCKAGVLSVEHEAEIVAFLSLTR